MPRTQRNVPLDTWPQVPAPAAPPHNQRQPDLKTITAVPSKPPAQLRPTPLGRLHGSVGKRPGLPGVNHVGVQELHLLQRHRDHQVPRNALSGAERITSAASEPKATKAAPRAALPGGELPGSESVQGSLFAGIDSVVSLPAPGPPTTWIDIRPLQAGAVAWRQALLLRPPAPARR